MLKIIKLLPLLNIISLCGCYSNQISSVEPDRYIDVTEVFFPTDEEHNLNGDDYYFVQFSFESHLEMIPCVDNTILCGGKVNIIKTIDSNVTPQFNDVYILFEQNQVADIDDIVKKINDYDSFLGYIGPYNNKYEQKAYEKEKGNLTYYDSPFFPWSRFYVVPIKSNNLLVDDIVDSFFSKDSLDTDKNLKVQYVPSRLELLFKNGDNIIDDFPQRLQEYNQKYDELRNNLAKNDIEFN